MSFWKTAGCYPPEYNPKVHGPYMPHRYYGPKDTPLAEVKVGELKDWLSRRNKTPLGIMHAASRMRQLWFYKWVQPRNATGACWAQVCVVTSLLFYVTSYRYQTSLRHREFH